MVNEKGVSPLIATILLLLVAMGIGALVWGFMQEYTTEQTSTAATTSQELADCSTSTAATTSQELADCSKASFKILSCSYESANSIVRVKLENTGSIDINDFWVNVQYSDGSASQIKDGNDLLAGAFGVIAGTATAAPSTVKVQSYSCSGVKDSTDSCPA